MNTLHGKSPCCHAKITKHGKRRRKCSQCGRTWSLRPKKRGPKPKRKTQYLLNQVLVRRFTINQLVRPLSYYTLRGKLRKELQEINENPPRYSLPKTGKFILLADGVWYKFRGKYWVLYLVALRSVESNRAWMLEPVLLPGRETGARWKQVIEGIPEEVKSRVCAMVCDGFKGGTGIARKHQWPLQRCHFHLKALLKNRQGRKNDLMGREIGRQINEILAMRDINQVKASLRGLRQLAESPQATKRIKGIAREFIRKISDFFNFLNFPEYHLPNTNNCMEAYAKMLRKKLYNISTPGSLELWSKAFIMLNKRIMCNGK